MCEKMSAMSKRRKAPIVPTRYARLMSAKDRKELGIKLPEEVDKEIAAKDERRMLLTLQTMLRNRGYWPRSPGWLKAERPPKGWQIHLHKTKRNPFILDIVLLGNDGRYLEFELKMPGRPYSSEEQRLLCEFHGYPKFEMIPAALEYIEEWEAAG